MIFQQRTTERLELEREGYQTKNKREFQRQFGLFTENLLREKQEVASHCYFHCDFKFMKFTPESG